MIMKEVSAMTEASGPTGDKARIDHAAEAIRDMTNDMMEELPANRRLADTLRRMTIEAPLTSLAIAFLLGSLVARR
jgi:hypothetical protein